MASEKPEKAKKEKKDKKDKKHKLAETDGVTKSKKEKKRKSRDASDALHNQLENSLDGSEVDTGAAAAQEGDKMDVDSHVITPIGALVPFANPLADEKQTKKVLKAVKKCKVSMLSISSLYNFETLILMPTSNSCQKQDS
jgi:H/ACA ribonucleoprotein complex subunit 2